MVNREEGASIWVEVVYALPEEQVLLGIEVEEGTTVGEAIERSGIHGQFPEIARPPSLVGIFGKRTTLGAIVRDGDRIEIYRRLTADPKEVRRAKAKLRNTKKTPG